MWWGGNSCVDSEIPEVSLVDRSSKTFSVPKLEIDELEENLNLLSIMDGDISTHPLQRIFRRSLALDQGPSLPALPGRNADPLEAFDSVSTTSPTRREGYWSSSSSFWTKWRADELKSKESALESANSKLAVAQREAAVAAAAAEKARLDQESKLAEEKAKKAAATASAAAAAKSAAEKPLTLVNAASPAQAIPVSSFELIMEEGKQYRSEFMQIWREISLAVSTNAANARSIQLNATKLLNALTRAGSQAGQRTAVVTWLSAVCGSKIVSQASGGNKTLVWSFAYLAKMVVERFPEVVHVGMMGELRKSGEHVMTGSRGVVAKSPLPENPKDFEAYARVWIALLSVMGDEVALWSWTTAAVNSLRNKKSFLQSLDAMWNMMKIFILLDVGLYDFRRLFGSQAIMIVETLERDVFPQLDAELQTLGKANSASVQFRFYLDACFNILRDRKFTSPPEGQVLAAGKETELNPEL